jgi:hypothetical protein
MSFTWRSARSRGFLSAGNSVSGRGDSGRTVAIRKYPGTLQRFALRSTNGFVEVDRIGNEESASRQRLI